jgi:hypothetical protein
MSDDDDESHDELGCLVLIAIASLSIGVGCLFGDGYGWLTLGAICFYLIIRYKR